MQELEFALSCVPRGQMRARATVRGRHASVYKASAQVAHEQTLAACLVPHRPDQPLAGPLRLQVEAYFPLPKSKPKAWKSRALHGLERPGKPDADNLAKHLCDVMGQLGFFGDDAQVASLTVDKYYTPGPGCWLVRLAQLAGKDEVGQWTR